MKCIICGNTEKSYIEGMCRDCYAEQYFTVEGIKKFPFSYCANCGAYRYGSKWLPKMEMFEAIEKSLLKNIKFKKQPEMVDVKINLPEHKKKVGSKVIGKIDVYFKTQILDNTKNDNEELYKEEEYQVPIKISYTLCDVCNRKKTEYFEGRIQIRNRKNEQFDATKKVVYDFVKNKSDVFITKEEDIEQGVDFYISSQKYVQNIGKELFMRFGGELTVTSKLFSKDKQTSKDLFRVDVLLRLPEYNIGDILEINQKLIIVSAVHEKKIVGVTLRNNTRISENVDKGFEIKARHKDVQEVIVTRRNPLEALHPETYQTTTIMNPDFHKDRVGEKIKVLIVDHGLYVVE